MADLKITQLTAGTCKATDLHVAVDTTDTTMAPSGTDKKYTLEQIANFNDVYSTGTNYQTQNENIILCTAAGITITLATADAYAGKVISIVDASNSASQSSAITIIGQAGQTINGLASLNINVAGGSVTLCWNGSAWNTVGVQNLNNSRITLNLASAGAAESNAPLNYIYRSRGTLGTPVSVNSNDRLYTQGIYAYDGSSFVEAGKMQFSVGPGSVLPGVVPGTFELDLLNNRLGTGVLNTAFKFDESLNASFYDRIQLGNDAPVAPFNGAQLSLDSGVPGINFGNGIAMRLVDNTTAALGNSTIYGRSRGLLGVPAIVQNGDYIFQNKGYAYDGASWIQNSEFRSQISGTVATGTVPANYSWSLMHDGESTLTEDLILTSAGALTLGVTTSSSPGTTGKFYTQFDQNKVGAVFENVATTASDLRGAAISFARARGTPASKTDVATGDIISQSKHYAYNNSGYLQVGEFVFKTEGTISTGNVPTLAQLYVYPSGSGAPTLTHTWNSNLSQSAAGPIFIGVTNSLNPSNDSMLYAQFDETKTGAAFELISSTNPDTQGSELILSRARGTPGTPTAVQDTDILGQFSVYGRSNASFLKCGELKFIVDSAVSSGQIPTRAELYVFKDLSGSATLTHKWNNNLTQTLYGAVDYKYLTATSTSTSDQAQIIGVVTNAGATTVTLLTADLKSGRTMYIFDRNGLAGTNTITIDTQGSETINGSASITINYDRGAVIATSDGSNWFATYTLGDENGGGSGVFTNPITIGVTNATNPNNQAMVYAQFNESKLGAAFELISSVGPSLQGSEILLSRARGTPGSLLDVESGDILGQIIINGHNNSSYLDCGELRFTVDAAISGGSIPTRAELYVFSSGVGKTLTHKWNNDLSQTLSGALDFKYLAATTSNSNQAQVIGVNTSGGATTITLLTNDLKSGRTLYVFDRTGNAATNAITIDTQGAETINGANSITINYARGAALLTSDGSNWFASYLYPPGATNGQLFIGSTGASPALTTLTAGSNVTITNAAGSITIASSGGAASLPTTVVTGTTQAAAVNNAYYSNNASQVVITLPSTASVGDVVEIGGLGTGGWRCSQNSGQQIVGLDTSTTTLGTGGYLESTGRYNYVALRCIVANTTWSVLSMCGNINFN